MASSATAYSLYLDEIGVPLVILSPGAPAGRVVDSPVSLRDLPATVVDQLGLSAGSPFPGRSLAAYWRSAPGQAPQGITTPALSEQADATAFQPQPRTRPRARRVPDVPGGLGPSLHPGRHGGRAALRSEERSVRADQPHGLSDGDQAVGAFRRMLLEVLTDNPGSVEVEEAYLEPYRQGLKTP